MTNPGSPTLLRGRFMRYDGPGYAQIEQDARQGASTRVRARIAVNGPLTPGQTVYFMVENIITGENVILGALTADIGNDFPPATMVMYPGATAPMGWALCDGSAISRVTYPDVFGALGTRYGNGDGTNTFNLPTLDQWIIRL